MVTMETDRLVDDYLRRLESSAAHLQRSRRSELVAEIREHIEAALREEDAASETAVRNVLERLGPPEEIVEAAEPPLGEAGTTRGGKLEIAAIIALLVPFVGWVAGMVLVALSRAWSSREKVIGLTLILLPIVIPAFGFVIGSSDGADVPVGQPEEPPAETGAVEASLFVLIALGGLPSALYFAWRLHRDGATAG
jgi:hypothetical protein